LQKLDQSKLSEGVKTLILLVIRRNKNNKNFTINTHALFWMSMLLFLEEYNKCIIRNIWC